MATSTVDPTQLLELVASLQAQVAKLTAQANGVAPVLSAEEIAGQSSGSVEALAFVEAMEKAIATKTYADSVAASSALVALLGTYR